MAENIGGMIALLLEYDGGSYGGWQYQENSPTVQGELEKACRWLYPAPVRLRGASRTDAGVHARGQVAILPPPPSLPPEKLPGALNWHLPPDIRVVRAYAVPGNFHPVTWARGKIYRYFIRLGRPAPAIGAGYCWTLPGELDGAAMNLAAAACIGRKDFASFQGAGSPVRDTTRTLRHLYCRRRGDWLAITCVGDGFLYNMVRILVGTLVEVGRGKLRPLELEAILAARDRVAAGPTAPARGLFLEKVLYRPSLDSYTRL